MAVGDEDDVSTPASVSAVGAAERHMLFSVECCCPVAALTGLERYYYFIYKHLANFFGGFTRPHPVYQFDGDGL